MDFRPAQRGLGGHVVRTDANGPGVQPGPPARGFLQGEQYVADSNDPQPLPQRWAIILLAGVLAGALVLSLAGPLPGLGAAGATVLALHKLVA